MSRILAADLTLNLVPYRHCFFTHAHAATGFIGDPNASDLEDHAMVRLIDCLGADNDLSSLSTMGIVLKVSG